MASTRRGIKEDLQTIDSEKGACDVAKPHLPLSSLILPLLPHPRALYEATYALHRHFGRAAGHRGGNDEGHGWRSEAPGAVLAFLLIPELCHRHDDATTKWLSSTVTELSILAAAGSGVNPLISDPSPVGYAWVC